MNKYAIFALFVSVCVFGASCVPLHDEFIEEGPNFVRQKRVTCDVLSAEAKGVKINHAACAAHCLVLGKKGGSCSNGVCHCRN